MNKHVQNNSSETTVTGPLSADELRRIDAWWRAANYLSVGQIYLRDNPLLKEPLTLQHVKSRLLGHWGTTPGLNFIYAHLNRMIKARDLNMIFITGPGHGGPGLLANTWLEGSYSEFYSSVPQSTTGMQRLFKQFSFPGGIPSHVAPETPGSIHEGGELGYSLSHAFGAVFDNPDLIAACLVGDGEAETGPLATAWHSNKFLNPARDGAVLPILHLNGYKIAGPTVLARIPADELRELLEGYGHHPDFVDGDDPLVMHQQMAAALGISASVRFLGVRAPLEVADMLRNARALVQHSMSTSYGDSESLGVVFLEAGASGLPVIATRHDGIPEVVIDQETGLLVDEGDVAGMAERMTRLIEDPILAGRLGQAARERICAEFGMEKSICNLWHIIENVIQQHQSSKTNPALH